MPLNKVKLEVALHVEPAPDHLVICGLFHGYLAGANAGSIFPVGMESDHRSKQCVTTIH